MPDLIPAGDSGEFLLTHAMLRDMDPVTMEAANVLMQHEAEARGLDLHISEVQPDNTFRIRWRPHVPGSAIA